VHGNYPAAMTTGFTSYRAPVSGRYRIKFSGIPFGSAPTATCSLSNNNRVVGHPPAIRWVEPNFDEHCQGRADEPITISTQGSQVNRRLGWFDLTPEPAIHDLGEVELLPTTRSLWTRHGSSVRPTVTRGIWTNPLAQRDGMRAWRSVG